MDNINKTIDEILQKRQTGIINYAEATIELIEKGVKIGHQSTGQIKLPNSFSKYLDKYNRSELEFEWIVEYNDGTILEQFARWEHNNFSDIDHSKLKKIYLVSNFTWPTSNKEKRVIVSLDFETGGFGLINGFWSQDDRAKFYKKEFSGEKKLILFCKKRYSATSGASDDRYKEFVPPLDEFFYFNRFIIGYQIVGTKEKRMLMVYPTGDVTIFE